MNIIDSSALQTRLIDRLEFAFEVRGYILKNYLQWYTHYAKEREVIRELWIQNSRKIFWKMKAVPDVVGDCVGGWVVAGFPDQYKTSFIKTCNRITTKSKNFEVLSPVGLRLLNIYDVKITWHGKSRIRLQISLITFPSLQTFLGYWTSQ